MTKTWTKTVERERGGRTRALMIGEVAKLPGVGVEALRFYEKSGLLDRPARTEGHVCGLIEGTEIEHAPAKEGGFAARRKVKR